MYYNDENDNNKKVIIGLTIVLIKTEFIWYIYYVHKLSFTKTRCVYNDTPGRRCCSEVYHGFHLGLSGFSTV